MVVSFIVYVVSQGKCVNPLLICSVKVEAKVRDNLNLVKERVDQENSEWYNVHEEGDLKVNYFCLLKINMTRLSDVVYIYLMDYKLYANLLYFLLSLGLQKRF